MATRVLVKQEPTISAVGFDVRNRDYIIIQAKAVSLCTGAWAIPMSNNHSLLIKN
ncbi:MAG: hypothetical protein V7K21_05115 [Nostoc sp.]|uniref:hypothetical protein n=1 Tax=Nostoc sp. TaxID=1180 RepID=UPI002FF52A20